MRTRRSYHKPLVRESVKQAARRLRESQIRLDEAILVLEIAEIKFQEKLLETQIASEANLALTMAFLQDPQPARLH